MVFEASIEYEPKYYIAHISVILFAIIIHPSVMIYLLIYVIVGHCGKSKTLKTVKAAFDTVTDEYIRKEKNLDLKTDTTQAHSDSNGSINRSFIEDELTKIESLFKKNLIDGNERDKMRAKVLAINE